MASESKSLTEPVTQSWLRPRFRSFGREWIAFQVAGVAGLTAALGLALAGASARGLSPLLVLAIFAAGILTFLALAMATKVLSGEEALIYYHHEIAVVASTTLLLKTLGVPALPYLDLTVLGIGTLLAFGRGGCLLAGCCHGRPCGWGIRYGTAHVRDGLPHGYSGVRLFPVQALESALVFSMVAAGVSALRTAPPGAIFAGYVTAYATVRFALELLRGDAPRPYWLGFSEAQWTSVAMLFAAVAGGYLGNLPHSQFHTAALGAVVLAMLCLRVARRPENELTSAKHHCELAAVLASLGRERGDAAIEIGVTSLGITVSRGQFGMGRDTAEFYSISRKGRPLSGWEAKVLAGLITKLLIRTPSGKSHLLGGDHGVFHLLN